MTTATAQRASVASCIERVERHSAGKAKRTFRAGLEAMIKDFNRLYLAFIEWEDETHRVWAKDSSKYDAIEQDNIDATYASWMLLYKHLCHAISAFGAPLEGADEVQAHYHEMLFIEQMDQREIPEHISELLAAIALKEHEAGAT